jgi:hypothetical protein
VRQPPISASGPNGDTASIGYDSNLRPSSTTSPFGAQTAFVYADNQLPSPPMVIATTSGFNTNTQCLQALPLRDFFHHNQIVHIGPFRNVIGHYRPDTDITSFSADDINQTVEGLETHGPSESAILV